MKAKWLACLAVLVVSGTVAYGVTPSFQGLGGYSSGAYGVSPDGSVVVGDIMSSDWQAVRWIQREGPYEIGSPFSVAVDVSTGGTVIVGRTSSAAFRWTEQTGMVEIVTAGSGVRANGVSADGCVVVGSYDHIGHAWRWTEANGKVLVGGYGDYANAVSADGQIIVGDSGSRACLWAEGEDVQILGVLPGGEQYGSYSRDVTPDGAVVVGSSDTSVGWEGFRWTNETGMIGLGRLRGSNDNHGALAVSANGDIIVGYGATHVTGRVYEAFIWDIDNGIRVLKDVLVNDYDLEIGSWSLEYAYDISYDGRIIVGCGHNPNGDSEAWIAVIPEPATLSLLTVGAITLLKRKRKSCGIRRRRK